VRDLNCTLAVECLQCSCHVAELDDGRAMGWAICGTSASGMDGKLMDIRSPVLQVYMLSVDAELNEATLLSILESGHSRIPVHKPCNRWGLLHRHCIHL
jgi:hypothetical protein